MNPRTRHPQSEPASRDTTISSPFVHSMKILFDILDEKQVGIVKFADIERRWSRDESSNGLPKGIIGCLRNVTTATGDLTFDRFCAGLKICLLKNESGKGDDLHSAKGTRAETVMSLPQVNQLPNLPPPPKPPRMSTVLCPPEPMDSSSRRREPRRHTLQNGIDYNRLKRLKQLEQEQNFLKETLMTLNETQNWLSGKLDCVQDQIRHVGRSSAPLESSPNHQERMELKRVQAAETSRQLALFVRNMSRIDNKNDLLFELNLETQWSSHERMQRLKQDNHRLLEELSNKQDIIARLENERMMIRQMKRY